MWSERRLAVAECCATTLLQPCRVLQFNVATMREHVDSNVATVKMERGNDVATT